MHAYSDLILLGNKSSRNRLSKCLYENLLKNSEDKHFHEILFDVNITMKRIVDPIEGHQQAIEYRLINMNKKLYFMNKEEMRRVIDANRKFMRKFKDIKIYDGFQKFFDKFDKIFGVKIYFDEEKLEIRFDHKEQLDLKYLIKHLNTTLFMMNDETSRHFILNFSNELLESIEENDFDEICFDEIDIYRCPKLKQIHWNAFGKQIKNIQRFFVLNEVASKLNTDYDLYKLINSLINCEEIHCFSFDYVLQPIKLNKLKSLVLDGYKSTKRIESIIDYAFYDCDELEEISLGWNNISWIGENAFYFRNENDKKIKIFLWENKLNESSFAKYSFNNLKRPTNLHLQNKNFNYESNVDMDNEERNYQIYKFQTLDENVFIPFLNANANNKIYMKEISAECYLKYQNYIQKIDYKYINFDDGLMIYETTLMENCKFIEIGDDEISKIFQRIKNDINIDIYCVEIFSRTLKRIHWNAF